MMIPFQHTPQAHCESGVTANLFRHHGLALSEPMAFGIGSGLFFAHIPFVKVNGVPGTTYRVQPGMVFNNVCRRLGVEFRSEKFRNAAAAEAGLDRNLEMGRPSGLQVSVFYLPFLPEVFRFHFNAHNLIVHGREGSLYHVSDPVMEGPVTIEAADLAKARFAKGYPEPKGRMYYLTSVPDPNSINWPEAIRKGIKQTLFFMVSPPLPWFGVNAIEFLSKQIRKYPQKLDARKATLYLGNIIRMQEEIGTGGAGFRFLYAAFLEEAAEKTGKTVFSDLSKELTGIGNGWRDFAYQTARICKARTSDRIGYDELADRLQAIYLREKSFFQDLKKANS